MPVENPSHRVAVVTGAARGIGAAVCARLVADGWRVAALDLRADCPELEDCLRNAPAGAWSYTTVDVSDREGLEAAVAAAGGMGTVAAGIANAGTWRDARIPAMTDDDWDTVIRVDLTAAFLLTRALWTTMTASGSGRLVYVSSIAKDGNFGQANYAAAKAGLVGLARTAAIEGGPSGITANVICPGVIDTPAQTEFRERAPQAFEKFLSRVPARRLGSPYDIANTAAFLCRDEASYLSGQVIYVDGALSSGP